jgi:ABC-type dipeptide/oligopeptide/nickel transport system ATPase subunit/GT2 family glycosyltransferase
MNITFVLAAYNNLNLTQGCYKKLREVYPNAPLVISSGGSSDGTKEWLESLEDENLSFFHDDDRLTFSQTYNAGIDLVDTEKLVLIHNDMVIGEGFLEAIERLLMENMILSYTTIEPPIFKDHIRPGKVILDLGSGFDNFKTLEFNEYVQKYKNDDTLHNGAVFFMSAYKKTFLDLNGFDGLNFFPCFCEDDDFLIRAKLNGYELKTCGSAITYHFVSQTSRYSEDIKDKRDEIELCSNRNFVRKWGMETSTFNNIIRYQNINDFKLESLRQQIAIVLQDVFLFADTIHNNITLNNPAISREKVIAAAKEIGVHKFIESLPNGYDYDVKERGVMLSSGQRQLIAFLRAYLSNPSILILDEATSSIDTYSEELIQKATETITKGRTSIVIAHRLATIINADKIIVMDKGQIVEEGSHQELVKKVEGYYRKLYDSQFSTENNS